MAKRIDSLVAGETVVLKFHGSKQLGNDSYQEEVTFVEVTGEGEERQARFSTSGNGENVFDVYRYNGSWAYGMSAEKLTVV